MYQIFTDSSSDLTKEIREKYNIDYFRMMININGKDYHADLNYEEYSAIQIYDWIKDTNNKIRTSLIPNSEFRDKMKKYLDQGLDILYIACTSALSGSFGVFNIVAEDLRKEYPDRKIVGIDSKRAGMTLGIQVIEACRLRDEGKTIEENVKHNEEYKKYCNLCGTVGTLTYLKAQGRVSAGAAFFGNLFSVKPIIVTDTLGHNCVIEKVKGSKASYQRLFEVVKNSLNEDDKNPLIYLGQGMAQEAVDYLKERFEKELNARVYDYWIGPIIGISCGPGVIHICYYGKEVTLTRNE